jgi:hypothetical protein
MSKTEKPSTGPASPNKPDAARRRLLGLALKGAAIGAPAIVTLKSGTAWALSIPCFQEEKYGVTPSTPPGGFFPTINGTVVDKGGSGVSQFCWESGNTSNVSWQDLRDPLP